jgi:ATP-dependent Clp protease ATP-binding subunit ClpC
VAKMRGVAKKESRRLNHYYLGVEHLMLGLLAEEESLIVSCLGDAFTAPQLRSEILSRLPKGEGPWYWDGIVKTPRYSRVMSRARKIKKEFGHSRMLPHHVFLAILKEGRNLPVRALKEMNADVKAAAAVLRRELQQQTPLLFAEDTETPFGQFCKRVICRKYLPDAIPFAGRGEELQKAIHAVTDLFKSVIVVGEPGAGKSAFVQELECHLQKSFSDSGLTYGGLYELKKGVTFGKDENNEEPESNFQNLITGIIATNALLCIEGLEVFLGMGFRSRAVSFAETLEMHLSSNELILVATTTPEGLLSCEMESKDIMSNFEVILLSEPSPELMLNILSSAREMFEAEHSLTIENAALAALMDLQYRMGDLVLPAKAIELLEHLCFLAKASAEPGEQVNIDADKVADFIQVHL